MEREHPTPPLRGDHFEVGRREVRDGVELAFLHEGRGGFPLVLLHGWPGSKRLWWRNVEPLAAAGFEVIVPDLRGFGDSTVPADPADYADFASAARDVAALLAALGHERCVAVGGDIGSGVCQDLALRFEGLVVRQVLFNGISPALRDEFKAAGIPSNPAREVAEVSDHTTVHSTEADRLAAELDTPEKRRAYVEGYFTGRVWKEGEPPLNLAGRGHFSPEEAAFQAEPFADAAVFRASLGPYEAGARPEVRSEMPRLLEINEHVPTLVLYGPEDEIVDPNYMPRMELAHRQIVGPFVVPESGHFVQWERPDALNAAIAAFARDLLTP